MSTVKKLLAADRAGLMLVLVPYVIAREEVPVDDAAREFGLAPAQVERLFRTLALVGAPGDGSDWAMPQDMFDIDWDLLDRERILRITYAVAFERAPRLSAREAAALVAGLQLVEALPGVGDSEIFAGLRRKLAHGASGTPAAVVIAPAPVDEVRTRVADAIARHVAVRFVYKTPDGPEMERTVDPVRVTLAGNQWYLQGWCHLRQAMRTFHLERVRDVVATGIYAAHSRDATPELFAAPTGGVMATVRHPASLARLAGEYLEGVSSDASDGVVTARVPMANAAGLRRLAARFGGAVEVVEPEPARRAVAEWAAAALSLYPDSSLG